MSNDSHEAIKELRNIIKLPDWSEFCPEKLREQQLEDWIARWIVSVEFTQAVVNTKYLTAEYNDVIKLKLAQSLAEDLSEECISFKTANKKITATICGMRRKAK